MAMICETTFDTGEVQLNVAEGPAQGVPLVLLHGGSARWQSWEPLLPGLLPHSQVFAVDLRGHGGSGRRPPYTLQAYAADIVILLGRRVGRPAVLCGHSLGGMVALLAAARLPDAVRGVIVGDSPLSGGAWLRTLRDTRERLEEWWRLAGSGAAADIAAALRTTPVEVPGQDAPLPARAVFGEDAPWFDWMAGNLARLDPATLMILVDDAERAAEGYSIEDVFPATRCPVWLVQADPAAGALMQLDEVRRAQQANPLVCHRRLDGVSHALHHTHPELVRDVLLECVRDIEQRGYAR